MTADDRDAVLRSSNNALRETLQNQLAAHRNLNQRSIDLVKIDLLAASLVVSGVSLAGTAATLPYAGAAIAAFLYSLLAAVRVFRPRHFTRGLGPNEVARVLENVDDGMPRDVHQEQLSMTYRDAVSSNSSEYVTEAVLFDRAVWASIAAVLFAALGAGAGVVSVSPTVVPLAYVGVPLGCLWAKNRYGFHPKVNA